VVPRGGHIQRRQFIALLGGAAAALPLTSRAQKGERVRHIAVIAALAENDSVSNIQQLRDALAALGWQEGKNIRFTYRYGGGNPERARVLAKEVVEMNPDLIVAHATPVVAALQRVTHNLPIVFVSVLDPVASGFVTSLARPGGNTTGFTNFEYTMGAKWLEVLKEIAPSTSRVALMLNPDLGSYYTGYLRSVETVALSNSVQATLAPVRNLDEIERTISALGRDPGGGLIVLPSAPITIHIRQIIEWTARYRLAAVYPFEQFAVEGGLVAYGVDLGDLFRRSTSYVDRILKGEKPADLPVQTPTKFKLVINLKTAKTLGLAVPPTLLARADEVIE
jgi:putative tryptophan/tyrosine transport system substrate-binding protein